jgi:DNA repair protein RadC
MVKERKAIGQKAMVGHPIAQATGIKTWPEDDRPREKLLKRGAGALSNSELLAILLRTGTQGTSAIDLARKILKKFSTFRNMAHTDARDWKEFKGLGGAKIAHIQAALEIGRRYREDDVSTGKQKIASAKDVVDIVMPQLRDLKTEMFKVVYLDSNNRIIDISDASVGTVDQAFPIVREIIHAALQKFAKSIVCVHNHPSSECSPSTQDRKFTQDLSNAGNLLDIKLLDHIIIAGDKHFSFADQGGL